LESFENGLKKGGFKKGSAAYVSGNISRVFLAEDKL
jgi:hypothetical protein